MLDIIFTGLGLIIGVPVLVFLGITYKKGPERLSPIIFQLFLGVLIIVVAFAWDLVFYTGIMDNSRLPDLHHFLMAASMVFFAVAAQKIYKTLK